jgi:hypothetical protein
VLLKAGMPLGAYEGVEDGIQPIPRTFVGKYDPTKTGPVD